METLLPACCSIRRNRSVRTPRIHQQAVQLKAMPLGNMTGITDDERAVLGNWFVSGAQ